MHEGNFTQDIVAGILESLKKRPGPLPEKITVHVGEMFHLEEQSVRMHYEVLVKGTLLEQTGLDLVEEPVRVKCHECGKTDKLEDHHWLVCSHCSSQNVIVVSGDAINIDPF